MELSGCDAVVIRADANLDLVVKALTFGLTLNAGATCISPKRVFVHRSLVTELEGRLANVFRSARPEVRIPFPETLVERLRSLIDEALANGAHLIAGEVRHKAAIVGPVILAGVSPASGLLREDLFVPLLSIVTVADDREAVMRANDCHFALTTSIFSRDEPTARLLASQIRAGAIAINDLILPTADPRLPLGGR